MSTTPPKPGCLAHAAAARADHTRAEALHERVRLLNLEYNLGRVRTGIYLILAHRVPLLSPWLC